MERGETQIDVHHGVTPNPAKTALNTEADIADNQGAPLPYPESFLTSDWKLLHDALQAHRFFVLHKLIPQYGLLSG